MINPAIIAGALHTLACSTSSGVFWSTIENGSKLGYSVGIEPSFSRLQNGNLVRESTSSKK